MRLKRFPPQDPTIIAESLDKFALADIKFNSSRPIAAFILCMIFIDQLSYFLYPKKIQKRQEKFIGKYLKKYTFKGESLFALGRHTLVHNYSSKGKIKVTNEIYKDVPFHEEDGVYTINTDVLIKNLEIGFKEACVDMLTIGSPEYINAKNASEIHPIIVNKGK